MTVLNPVLNLYILELDLQDEIDHGEEVAALQMVLLKGMQSNPP